MKKEDILEKFKVLSYPTEEMKQRDLNKIYSELQAEFPNVEFFEVESQNSLVNDGYSNRDEFAKEIFNLETVYTCITLQKLVDEGKEIPEQFQKYII